MAGRYPQPRRNIQNWRMAFENVQNNPPNYPSNQPPPKYINAFLQNNKIEKPISSKKPNTYCHRFMDGFDSYCDTSSIHGLKYVGMNDISKAERIFWFVAFLGAVGMSIYFISNLYINYNDNPVIVSFNPTLVGVQDIPFPAITICNLNIAYRSRAEEIAREGTPVEKVVLEDLCNSNNTSSTTNNSNVGSVGSIPWRTMENIITNITQRCSEMILACRWQGQMRVCTELINSIITDDGYCCSFNRLPPTYSSRAETQNNILGFPEDIIHWNAEEGYPSDADENVYPYRAFGRGVEQGLSLALDADLDQYYCSTTSGFGFKVVFSTPSDAPKIADVGFLVKPGIEMRLAINVDVQDATDDIRNIDYSKRGCFFARERYLKFYKLYSTRNCLMECEANYTLKVCGCVNFDMPKEESTRICGKSDDVCFIDARYRIERIGPEKLACNCLPACYEIKYLPHLNTEAKLDDFFNVIEPYFLGNKTTEYFVRNMAIVHFFFGDEKYKKLTKSALYGFSEFLSNTGGLLGLFMGFSFLSVVEIFYVMFMKSLCKWSHIKMKEKKNRLLYVR